jgi:methylmalonyl-CoA epimerase
VTEAPELPPGVEVLGVHHVAIAVSDLDAAVATWTGALGARVELRAELPEQGVEAVSLDVGTGCVELVTPLPRPEGARAGGVARFLERSGNGLHHVALSVAEVAAAIATLTAAGVRMVDEVPRTGLHGGPIAFVHPSGANGVLVELVQVRDDD